MPRTVRTSLISILYSSFYANSMWMVLASLTSAGVGFIFWIVAAKLFSSDEVGLASAAISAGLLIVAIARVGLEQATIRFFPEMDKNLVYTSVLAIILIVCAAITLVYYLLIDFVSPSLSFLRESYPVFFLFVIMSSLLSLTGCVFTAIKKSRLYFVQSIVYSCRLLFLPPLIAYGAFGILGSMGAGTMVAACFSMLIISREGLHLTKIDSQFLRSSLSFSLSNYVAGLLIMAPGLLLPIISLGALGTNAAAYYYMAYSISSFLFLIPNALSTSLFIEGSNGSDLQKATARAIKASILALIVMIAVTVMAGYFLLAFIGQEYVENGYALLILLSVSSLPMAFVQVAFSILMVKKKLRDMILFGFVQFLVIISSSLLSLQSFGLTGAGLGWLTGQTLMAAISIAFVIGRRSLVQALIHHPGEG